ncbi:phage tail tip protein J-related protein [Salinicola aestuarinus]|uniref:phage tail tip protein J-related protein n=1 Tax=Salinicola aestuarinus TaxID=1949082 RepID=UPI000DA1DF01|nr:phage tail protein [Salinicola aestuarinus]
MGKAVKAVASVAVGVAVGFATGNPYLGVMAGGAMFAAGSLTPEVDQGVSSQTELKQVIRSSKEPAHYQFGRCAVGGLLAWAQEEEGDQTKREWLYLVYVLSEGEIESIDELYLNQEPIADAGDRATWALIRNPSSADPYLLENSPDWRDNQVGHGLSYARVSLRYDRDYFASGIPTPLFVLRGNREIYDPRDESTGYSENAALVILWYLRTRLRVPDDEIIWEMFVSSANVSDEVIETPSGDTERRYTIGGGFKADARKDRVLADMEAACAGKVVRIGGRFGLVVGAYYGPYELTIDESMVVGTVSGQTETSQADAVNVMRGKFIDPDQRWTETDYPAVRVDEWVEQDGGEIEDTLDLPFVFSPYQSQRLANIALRRKRAGGMLTLPLNFRGYACRPGRVVRVRLPSLNIDGEFRVEDWDFHGDSGCKVTLAAEDPEIYDDAVGEPYNPLGFISLPTGGIAAPAGLTYTLEAIGETVQGRLDWSAVSGAQSYSVVLRANGESVQAIEVPPNSTTCTIGGLPAGQYVAEVRTRGSFGQSGAATVTFSVNAPPMPDSVLVQATNTDITLIPRLDWRGTPVSFRFYYSPSPLELNAVRGSAQLLSTGATLVHTGRSFGTTYYYWVESVNAYGHSDLLFKEVATTSDFNEIFGAIQQNIEGEGTLYDTIVNGVSPGVIDEVGGQIGEAAEQAVAPFRDELDANTDSIGELQHADQETALKLLLLKAGGEASASTLRVEQIVRADLAQQVTTLETGQSSLTQRLTTAENSQGSMSQLLTQLQTAQASVEDNLYTLWDPETESFTSTAIRTVDVGGRKAILGMQSDGQTAAIGAIADQFYVYNEVSGEMVTAFVVEDGRVVMPEALIGKLNVNKLVTDTGETLVEGGYIKTQFIDADSLEVDWANIKNVKIKSAMIDDAEIDGAKIRNGTIDTLQIKGGAVTISDSTINSGRVTLPSSDGDHDWRTIAELDFNPQGNDVKATAAFVWYLLAKSDGDGKDYARASMLLRISVNGSPAYQWDRAHDRLLDLRKEDRSNPRVEGSGHLNLPIKFSGWNGSRTVRLEASTSFNLQGNLSRGSAWVEEIYFDLDSTRV